MKRWWPSVNSHMRHNVTNSRRMLLTFDSRWQRCNRYGQWQQRLSRTGITHTWHDSRHAVACVCLCRRSLSLRGSVSGHSKQLRS